MTDELFNNLVINPSVDSIEEFKIQKSMYPAEFGGKASALINVATQRRRRTRSAAALFEFLRNDAFDAHELLRPDGPARAAAAPEPVRRHARRAARARTGRSSSPATKGQRMTPLADADVLGADRGRPRRRFRRARRRSATR